MNPRHGSGATALALAFLLFAAPLTRAQTPSGGNAGLPSAIAAELLEFFNRRETIRMAGESRIAPGTEVVGDVAVLGGPFTVSGRIRGRLVVINGDVRLEPGAAVEGDLTVVGGVVAGLDSAVVSGTVLAYRESLRFRNDGDRLVAASPPPDPEISAGRDFLFGRTDLTLAVHRGYNRVEGLPILAGPRFETRSSNPTRAEALLIYRTVSGVRPAAHDLGYMLRAEQFLGGRRALRLGATLHSEVAPIEERGLSDRENSLATFVLHRDYRDHYERTGWSAYLRLAPRGRPHDLTLEYRSEHHGSVAARHPWAIVRNDDDWRLQPVVAEGTLRSVAARLRYDTRNEGADPTAGWYIRAEVERALGGSLAHPALAAGDQVFWRDALLASHSAADEDEFAVASLDLRRYARLGPTSHLALRSLVASSLNDRPLPPQRQHALGGEGSLPGYSLFRFDCGARDRSVVLIGEEAFFPYYGCDRMVLVQLEYRNDFPFGRGWGRKLGWDMDLGETPGWVVFFDAGRVWTERVARDGRTQGQDDFAADTGVGFRFGRLGIYWAFPLSGSDRGINFFMRLGSRL